MAYRFSSGDQPVSQDIRRIFLEEVDSALHELGSTGPDDRDRRIHETRKSFKKLRALLRLLDAVSNEKGFRRENHRLRDVGRKLSELRDAQAIIDSFAALPKGFLPVSSRQLILETLEGQKVKIFESLDAPRLLQAAVKELAQARSVLNKIPLKVKGPETLEAGLLATYRKGRKKCKKATQLPDADNLHNLRKRVKDHWYHTRLVNGWRNPFFMEREEELHKLESLLGDSHNLHVLRERLAEAGQPAAIAAFQLREKELGQRALALAAGLYHLPARKFKHELSTLSQGSTTANPQPSAAAKMGKKRPASSLTLDKQIAV